MIAQVLRVLPDKGTTFDGILASINVTLHWFHAPQLVSGLFRQLHPGLAVQVPTVKILQQASAFSKSSQQMEAISQAAAVDAAQQEACLMEFPRHVVRAALLQHSSDVAKPSKVAYKDLSESAKETIQGATWENLVSARTAMQRFHDRLHTTIDSVR